MFGFFNNKDAAPNPLNGAARHGRGLNGTPKPAVDRAPVQSDPGPETRPFDGLVDLPEAQIVSSLNQVGDYSDVLTSTEAQGGLRVPLEMENHLVALQTGVKQAVILYDRARLAQTRAVLSAVRATLRGDGYRLDRERQASPEVIRALVEQAAAKRGLSATGPTGESQGRALWDSWVTAAVEAGATDIHIDLLDSQALVRLRIDGDVEPLADKSRGRFTAVQAENAIGHAYNFASGRGANSNSSYDRNQAIYTMTEPMIYGGKKVALRFQSLPGWRGPKVTARILHVGLDMPTMTFAQAGYEADHISMWMNAQRRATGLNLIAGVTGSGKSTAQKTFIETHPNLYSSSFITIEDPVEYPLRGTHQFSVQRDISDEEGSLRRYKAVVAAIMRLDPDAVFIGEIRDRASASAAQQIVETGHMSMGTVHAHLVSGIIPRLTNDQIGMSRQVLTAPNMLSLLVYQALVPKNCPHCALGFRAVLDGDSSWYDAKRIIKMLGERFKVDVEKLRFRRPNGCDQCRHRGTNGLTVVAEMLEPDHDWLRLTRDGKDYEAIDHWRSLSDRRFDSSAMAGKTVFEHCLYKALQGMVDPRRCQAFDTFERFAIR